MTSVLTRILDNWSHYDFKKKFTENLSPWEPPDWVDEDDKRRLKSYKLLESYCSNKSAEWISELSEDPSVKERREYGDPSVMVETTLSSLLGNNQRIVVAGALGQEDAEAVMLQETIEKWAEDEHFLMKLNEETRNEVRLGDGVWVLGWDPKKKRPVTQVYDPGFYFPVFEPREGGGERFPKKVHIAYEFEEEDPNARKVLYVRRMTWELVDTEPWKPPYQDEMADTKCLFSDGIWEKSEIGRTIFKPKGVARVEWIVEAVELDIDFIPVIHIPNTVAVQEHFGQSVLASVLQILDDIQATDTDTQRASATTGSPPIAVSGQKSGGIQEITTYGPGMVFYTGEGNATLIDTSRALDALLKLKDSLLSRLSVNGRTPESLLGRVKPNEVPSGIAITLSFAPHTFMIITMRMIRTMKYKLFFKMIQRLAIVNSAANWATSVIPTELLFGSFLPADKQETMTIVTQLYAGKVISLETAIQMLAEAGYPIEDWKEEVARIKMNDFDGANSMVAITGDANAGLEYMGRPPIPEEDMITTDPNAQPDAIPA